MTRIALDSGMADAGWCLKSYMNAYPQSDWGLKRFGVELWGATPAVSAMFSVIMEFTHTDRSVPRNKLWDEYAVPYFCGADTGHDLLNGVRPAINSNTPMDSSAS